MASRRRRLRHPLAGDRRGPEHGRPAARGARAAGATAQSEGMMDEFRVVTLKQLHDENPDGKESDWVEFARLCITSSRLNISDPMYWDVKDSYASFETPNGEYSVSIK